MRHKSVSDQKQHQQAKPQMFLLAKIPTSNGKKTFEPLAKKPSPRHFFVAKPSFFRNSEKKKTPSDIIIIHQPTEKKNKKNRKKLQHFPGKNAGFWMYFPTTTKVGNSMDNRIPRQKSAKASHLR